MVLFGNVKGFSFYYFILTRFSYVPVGAKKIVLVPLWKVITFMYAVLGTPACKFNKTRIFLPKKLPFRQSSNGNSYKQILYDHIQRIIVHYYVHRLVSLEPK